jgi:hypothetical protein
VKNDNPPHPQTPFERFDAFTRRIVVVPKAEIDKKMRAYERRKWQRKRKENLPG